MRGGFRESVVRGAMAILLWSALIAPATALIAPATALAQEKTERAREEEQRAREEEQRAREEEHRVRVLGEGPTAAVLFAGRSGAYLGVRLAEVDDEVVERLRLPEERGALVLEVLEETPAEEAGLQPDDVIVSWNGARVESAAQLSRLVRETPPGRTVRLGVLRSGEERTVAVELAERSGVFRMGRGEPLPGGLRIEELLERARERGDAVRAFSLRLARPRLGVTVTSLSEQLGEYFGTEEGKGALVTEVLPETPAAQAGLRAGDVILSVAGEEVDGPGDISRILRHREGTVEVRILRERQPRTLTVELEAPEPEPGGAALQAPPLPALAPVHALPMPALPPVHALPMPALPPVRVPSIEIEVLGTQEPPASTDWDAYADQWQEWAKQWEEQAADWAKRWKEQAADWETEWQEWAKRWKEQAADWETEWQEWAKQWEEQAADWAKRWKEQAADWSERLEAWQLRPDRIEAGGGRVIFL